MSFYINLSYIWKANCFDICNMHIGECGLLDDKQSRGSDKADDMLSHTKSEIL